MHSAAKRSFIALSLLSPALLLTAQAQGAGHFRFEHEDVSLTFNQDMTLSRIIDITLRAVDDVGAKNIGQQYFYYQAGREKGTIELAETIAADGKVTPVTADNIKQQDGVVGGVTNPDNKIIQVTFPKLSVGDAIHYRYRYDLVKADGGSSDYEGFNLNTLFDDVHITLTYPKGLALAYRAHNIEQTKEIDGPQQVREWRFHNDQTETQDYGAINAWKQNPYLLISTYPSWAAVAASYQSKAEPKAKVTPEVTELAISITKGIDDQREQVHALYDWVRKNIRYVASYIGDGGWVPHDTHEILTNRFGDCKDHATLLEALLESRNIAASQVLINAGTDNFTLPDLPMRDFNHAITYVPSLNLFLDSTADHMPFGLLPEMDDSKPVLITKNFSDIAYTPVVRPEQFKMTRHVQIKVNNDGSGERTTEVTGNGRAAVAVHDFIAGIGSGKEADWMKQYMADNGWLGNGHLDIEKFDGSDVERYKIHEHIENFVYQPEAGELEFDTDIQGPIALNNILRRYAEGTRRSDAKCDPFAVEDVVDIELSPSMKVVYVPKDVSIHDDIVGFDAHYEKFGNTYRVTRKWGFHATKATCTPTEYLALRPMVERIRKALYGTIVYVPRKG